MTWTWVRWFWIGWFFWTLVVCLAETRKHGQPRTPHNAFTSALAAVLSVLMLFWLIFIARP